MTPSTDTAALVREARERAADMRLMIGAVSGATQDNAISKLLDRLASALEAAQGAEEAERDACAVAIVAACKECDADGMVRSAGMAGPPPYPVRACVHHAPFASAIRARSNKGEENG